MRKTLLLLAILAVLPVAAFAQLGVGGAAFYKSPVLLGQPVDTNNLNVDQFSFGGDVRFKLGWFQVQGLALYSAGTVSSFNSYFDVGVALDVAILRLSLGAGPNFVYNIGATNPVRAGLNAKIGADVILGSISAGMSYIMALNLDSGVGVNTSSGLLGAQVLFWL